MHCNAHAPVPQSGCLRNQTTLCSTLMIPRWYFNSLFVEFKTSCLFSESYWNNKMNAYGCFCSSVSTLQTSVSEEKITLLNCCFYYLTALLSWYYTYRSLKFYTANPNCLIIPRSSNISAALSHLSYSNTLLWKWLCCFEMYNCCHPLHLSCCQTLGETRESLHLWGK